MSRNIFDIKGVSGKLTAENLWDMLVIYFPILLLNRITRRRYNLIMLLRSIWIDINKSSFSINDIRELKRKCMNFVMEHEE